MRVACSSGSGPSSSDLARRPHATCRMRRQHGVLPIARHVTPVVGGPLPRRWRSSATHACLRAVGRGGPLPRCALACGQAAAFQLDGGLREDARRRSLRMCLRILGASKVPQGFAQRAPAVLVVSLGHGVSAPRPPGRSTFSPTDCLARAQMTRPSRPRRVGTACFTHNPDRP